MLQLLNRRKLSIIYLRLIALDERDELAVVSGLLSSLELGSQVLQRKLQVLRVDQVIQQTDAVDVERGIELGFPEGLHIVNQGAGLREVLASKRFLHRRLKFTHPSGQRIGLSSQPDARLGNLLVHLGNQLVDAGIQGVPTERQGRFRRLLHVRRHERLEHFGEGLGQLVGILFG